MSKSLKSAFEYIMNIKMKNKIILLCVLAIVASTTFTGLIVYQGAASIIEKNVYNHTSETIQQSVNFLNEKLNSVLIQAHLLQTNSDFITAIKNVSFEKRINYALEFSRVEPILSQMKARDRFIHSILVYTPRGSFYNITNMPRKNLDVPKTKLFDKVEEDGLIYWGVAGEDEIFHSENPVIPIIMKITIWDLNTSNMFVIVNLKQSTFANYLTRMTEKTKGEVYILNHHNDLVTGVEKGQYVNTLGEKDFIELLSATQETGYFKYYNHNSKEKLLVNVSRFPINEWRMVSIQREKDIKSDISMIKALVFLSALIFISLTTLLSVFLASSITKPINRLQKMMEVSPEQHFSNRFHARYNDEVGQLGQSFDFMSDQIQTLLEKLKLEQEHVKQEQQLKRKAELKALQAQINPHFLYNALDSIYWRSAMQGNDLVSEMAISLSNLFRMGLNKGKEITTIHNELQHVENYLKIQKIIYEGKFDYEINADKEVLEYKTVKLILQPLVENSIVHGFEDMEKGGRIVVNVKKENDKVCFEVIDNGCGFEEKEMMQVLQTSGQECGGYALSNVFQRIKLHYGEEYGLNIKSVPFEETKIAIWIPAVKEEANV